MHQVFYKFDKKTNHNHHCMNTKNVMLAMLNIIVYIMKYVYWHGKYCTYSFVCCGMLFNLSMSQTNIAMKHGKKKCHNRNVQSRQTIIIINMSMSLVKTNAQARVKCNDIKSSQCVINSRINTRTKRGGYPLIDQSN